MQGWGWGCRMEWIVELIVVKGSFGVHFGFFGEKEKKEISWKKYKKKTRREISFLFVGAV